MIQLIRRSALLGFALSAALLTAGATDVAPAGLGTPPPGFSAGDAQVNGTSLHYVSGGNGPAVILVHGFPEDWVEFRTIMPRLARRFTVVAVDLPGVGHSAPAAGGYDAANLAAHIHALTEALHLAQPYLVGHDHGAILSYAFVRQYPETLRGAIILATVINLVSGLAQ